MRNIIKIKLAYGGVFSLFPSRKLKNVCRNEQKRNPAKDRDVRQIALESLQSEATAED